jgi:hypothetical protein
MAFKVPRKKTVITNFYLEKDQKEINDLLFNKKCDSGEELKYPKQLTIIILKKKEPYFHFLKNETEFGVQGQWHSQNSHKVFKEKNAEINVIYLDDKDDTVTKKLKTKLNAYNKKYVKEEVLFVTATPLDMTTLKLR